VREETVEEGHDVGMKATDTWPWGEDRSWPWADELP
jgi:hypothetical protein